MKKVAEAAGMSTGHLCDIENGKVVEPGFFKILKLLELYDMKIGTLMGEYEKDKSESDAVE